MTSAIWLGVGAMLFWGAGDFLAGVASRRIGEKSAFFWIQVLMWLLIVPVLFFQRESVEQAAASVTALDLCILLTVGLAQVAGYLLFFKGMRLGQIGLVSALTSAWAVVPLAISILFFQETVGPLQWCFIGLIFAGIFLAVGSWPIRLGDGLKEALLTLLIFGVVMTAIVPYAKKWGWFPPIFFLRSSMMFWSLCFLWRSRGNFPKKGMLLAVSFSAAFDFAAFLFYAGGMTLNYVSVVAPISAAYPATALVLAVVFLKERLSPLKLLGVIGIILGVAGQGF